MTKMTQDQIVDLVIKKSKQKKTGWNGDKKMQFAIQIGTVMYYGKTQSVLVREIERVQNEVVKDTIPQDVEEKAAEELLRPSKEKVSDQPVGIGRTETVKKMLKTSKRILIFGQSVTSVCSAMFIAGFTTDEVRQAIEAFGIKKKSICKPTKKQEEKAAKLTAEQMTQLSESGKITVAV